MPPHYSRRLGKRPRPMSPEQKSFPLRLPFNSAQYGRYGRVDWNKIRAWEDWGVVNLHGSYVELVAVGIIQRRWAQYTKRQAHLRSLFGFSNHFDPYDSPG